MRSFIFGFATAIVLLVLAGFCYLRFGLVDPRADIAPGALESGIAMSSLDAAVDRRAPVFPDPVLPTEDDLVSGMKIYQANCAMCHGDIGHPHGGLAGAFYPRAPQFMEVAPDMPENENYYIIQHGIRLSGMPAWGQVLSERDIWQTAAFLSRMDNLPAGVSHAWRSASGGTLSESPSLETGRRNNDMNMPMR